MATQRLDYSKSELHLDRIASLNTLGFEWKFDVGTWEKRFAELSEYKEQYGNTRVPTKWPENRVLAGWVVKQRHEKRRGKLRVEIMERLNALGFEWEVPRPVKPARSIESRISELAAYRAQFGHLSVRRHDKNYPGLADWMSEQRARLKAGKLSPEIQSQLDAIEFPWIPLSNRKDDEWLEMFLHFKQYAEQHGVATVAVVDLETAKLNRWMLTQRQLNRRGKLSKARAYALNQIGFHWQRNVRRADAREKCLPAAEVPITRNWDEMFSELVEFFKIQGHCNVPDIWPAQPELARWVSLQRRAKKQESLAPELVRRMEEIGFAWTTHAGGWDVMFARLVEYMRPMHNGKPRKASADDELKRWMITQRQSRKRGDLDPEREERLSSIGFDWNPFSSRWHRMLNALKEFHTEHGHCQVPTAWIKDPVLANWVGVQRAQKVKGKLSPERQAELDALGFTWRLGEFNGSQSPHEAWSRMFERLANFHEIHGHSRVPQLYPQDQKLGWWVATQRRNRRKGKLRAPQIEALDRLGFKWSPGGFENASARWQGMLAALKAFREENGHCRVPAGWKENPQLANWVGVQRQQKKHAILDSGRIEALDEIGFDWHVDRASHGIVRLSAIPAAGTEEIWEEMFLLLLEYRESHGNCLVPQKWKENRSLAGWVSDLRGDYKRGHLDSDRIRRLDEIGFEWDPLGNRWEKMFQNLVEFKNEHGHTNVPQGSPKHAALATWVHNQRAAKRYNRPIIDERGKRLDEIGFVWRLVEPNVWEQMMEQLIAFKAIHGHCNVPQKGGENKKLGRWVNTLRTHFKLGKLKPHRIAQLEGVGFVWNTKAL